MRHNAHYISIPETRKRYESWLRELSLEEQIGHVWTHQSELMLGDESYAEIAKIIHPLFIRGYRTRMTKHTDIRMSLVGLDIETVHTTGHPRLLGIWNDGEYSQIHHPTPELLYKLFSNTNRNEHNNYVCWGQLDIQCLIRVFNPTDLERKQLSRGISGRISRTGEVIIPPPIAREIGNNVICIMQYIPQRAMRIGWIERGFLNTRWIYNAAQFYQATIATSAKGLNLTWKDYAQETHLVDWDKYATKSSYRNSVNASNRQDARICTELTYNILDRFYETFQAYPTLLVSTGSLADSAVSMMLDEDDYNSNSWSWLTNQIWKNTDTAKIEGMLSEAFSAGYVDAHGIGLYPEIFMADISSAYPFQIRRLPDLRYAYIVYGEGKLDEDLALHNDVETAIIRGTVTIPRSLVYHPITIKTLDRSNIRPQGTFRATYTLEERDFCEKYGATFTDEEYAIVALHKRETSAIAQVSAKLGNMRNDVLAEMRQASGDARTLLDGRQYIIKVVDNSLYGKTVMLTESVVMQGDKPVLEGYITGDRYNLLYGTMITARTRTLLSEAAMEIYQAGGHVILLMTDSIYWTGRADMLSTARVAAEKTAGLFEKPVSLSNMYLLKTGLYEYQDIEGVWHYKLRGYPLQTKPTGKESILHASVREFCANLPSDTSPRKITIPFETKRLVTIGSPNLAELGLIRENITEMRPFVLGSKHEPRVVADWKQVIDGNQRLLPITLDIDDTGTHTETPYAFLRNLYEGAISERNERRTTSDRKEQQRLRLAKQVYMVKASNLSGKGFEGLNHSRPYLLTWDALETYFGVSREDIT